MGTDLDLAIFGVGTLAAPATLKASADADVVVGMDWDSGCIAVAAVVVICFSSPSPSRGRGRVAAFHALKPSRALCDVARVSDSRVGVSDRGAGGQLGSVRVQSSDLHRAMKTYHRVNEREK